MNVFKYEMKQHRRSVMVWALTYALVAFVLMSATPLFIEDSSAMRDTLAAFSDSIRDAMGIDIDLFFSPVGFYSYIFLYVGLLASIQAMSVGLGIVSKENRMKTADFLLSKPVSRVSVYWQKWLAAFCVLIICEAAFYLSATLSMAYQSAGDFPARPFILISLTFTFIQMIFMSVGFFIATVAHKIKSTLTVTMGVCFGAFLLGMVGGMADSVTIRYFTPLRYFDNNYIMFHNAYETKFLVMTVLWVVLCTLLGFVVYVKKDVHTAM